jgi:saccharopine dehydrogenase-like NADP-dependent oxidoreductase
MQPTLAVQAFNKNNQMKSSIFIAGSGGIGQAAALILAESDLMDVTLYVGDISQKALDQAIDFVSKGCTKDVKISGILMPKEGSNDQLDAILQQSDIILDCLPGSQAPRLAKMAVINKCHYANLTEYVQETKDVMALSQNAETGFVLQTGLAPGFINILAHKLYQEFTSEFNVDVVDAISMKVGAISRHAAAPYYYAFTWSPIGVATEYMKDAEAVRDFKKVMIPALSNTQRLIIDGEEYEDDFTSGGAADLPDALAGKVKNLDYKTIRYVGHYQWVRDVISELGDQPNVIDALEAKMLATIPSIEDDLIIVFASVQGKDEHGRLRKKEKSYKIPPTKVGNQTLRAIQSTTAAPLCEAAYMLLSNKYKGTVLQSQLDTDDFLNGPFVSAIYGKYN